MYSNLEEIRKRISLEFLTSDEDEQPVKFAENQMEFLMQVLSEKELQRLAKFGKRLTMHKYSDEEVDSIFDAINMLLDMISLRMNSRE